MWLLYQLARIAPYVDKLWHACQMMSVTQTCEVAKKLHLTRFIMAGTIISTPVAIEHTTWRCLNLIVQGVDIPCPRASPKLSV